jgi:hypothetical protein
MVEKLDRFTLGDAHISHLSYSPYYVKLDLSFQKYNSITLLKLFGLIIIIYAIILYNYIINYQLFAK